MGNAKWMKPLFVDGQFNREGRKKSVVFVKEVSDGEHTYRLWQSAGKPDHPYPRNEKDAYILYTDHSGYLISLSTEFDLINHCGFQPMIAALYGGENQRGEYFQQLQQNQGPEAVAGQVAREEAERQRWGSHPVYQAKYIQSQLDRAVAWYLEFKESQGKTPPNYIGALLLDELPVCIELAKAYRAYQDEQEKLEQKMKQKVEQERQKEYAQTENQKTEQKILHALEILKNGGVQENIPIEIYQWDRDCYTSVKYTLFQYLMKRFGISVPIRTQGWINQKLYSVTICNGMCDSVRMYSKRKHPQASETFLSCMDELLKKIAQQELENEDSARDGTKSL